MARDLAALVFAVLAVVLSVLTFVAPVHFVWQYLIGVGALLSALTAWDLRSRSLYPWWQGGRHGIWK